MSDIKLKDLRYLVAVADTGHFGKAAQRCFISQPTLSAQLKKLEDYLGVQLIERQPRGATLNQAGAQIVAPMMAAGPSAAPARNEAAAGAPSAPPANVKRVTAPLTGVFYRASSPDAESFVNPGDRVENGSVLCILEAMKLFNEIQSDFAGTIARIVPENGELVSQGDDLFWIEP